MYCTYCPCIYREGQGIGICRPPTNDDEQRDRRRWWLDWTELDWNLRILDSSIMSIQWVFDDADAEGSCGVDVVEGRWDVALAMRW